MTAEHNANLSLPILESSGKIFVRIQSLNVPRKCETAKVMANNYYNYHIEINATRSNSVITHASSINKCGPT